MPPKAGRGEMAAENRKRERWRILSGWERCRAPWRGAAAASRIEAGRRGDSMVAASRKRQRWILRGWGVTLAALDADAADEGELVVAAHGLGDVALLLLLCQRDDLGGVRCV